MKTASINPRQQQLMIPCMFSTGDVAITPTGRHVRITGIFKEKTDYRIDFHYLGDEWGEGQLSSAHLKPYYGRVYHEAEWRQRTIICRKLAEGEYMPPVGTLANLCRFYTQVEAA